MALGVVVGAAACSSNSGGVGSGTVAGTSDGQGAVAVTASGPLPVALTDLMATAEGHQWITNGDDLIEVWVCHVPLGSIDSIYGGMQLRLDLTARSVADEIRALVPHYYETISHGAYRPVFRAGGEVTLTDEESPQDCLDQAIAGAGPDAQGVFAVANAEHTASSPGGFGNIGEPCVQPPCPVSVTGRSAYIGASDFHPDWGEQGPMDLVEHELGHMLGWAHSGVARGGAYLSALDVMSNSAAPRDTNPDARDAPDTLALNRLLAGWLPESDVWSAPSRGGTVELSPSAGEVGTRLAVVGLGDKQFLTIELLTADGFNAHLPASGVAVHIVAVADGEVDDMEPLVGETPFAELLQPGDTFDSNGWRIMVAQGWSVTVTPLG